MREAHTALEQGNTRFALVAAGRAIGYNPRNLDACRTMADLLEKAGNSTALEWRERAFDIDRSLQNALALVATALRFKKVDVASQTLERLAEADKNTAGYHSAAAHIEVARRNLADAESHLVKAVELAPEDPHQLLELAIFQLNSDRPEKREEGRQTAERLKANPQLRARALRTLVAAAAKEHNSAVTLDRTRELQDLPEATFDDRLLYLSALKGTADPATEQYLAKLQAEARTDADKVFRLMAWMNSNGFQARTIDWKASLSPAVLDEPHVRLSLADAYVARQDWSDLQELVTKGTWGGFEFLRFALKARVARARGNDAEFTKNWTEALRLASDQIPSLKLLEQVALGWGWKKEGTDVLWVRADTREGASEALDALSRLYDQDRDTHGLYRVMAHRVQITPDDPTAKNNLAQLALLLNVDVQTARVSARDLYLQHPKDPVFVSTYAFALEQVGDFGQALKIMSGLTPDELRAPNTAAYYGIILAAARRPQEAVEYLKLAEHAQLLPEEEELVTRAKNEIAAH